MPTTICLGRPQDFCSAQTMASSGLVIQITKAFGAYFVMPAPTCSITLRLMPIRSSRLMPGFRGTPGGDDADISPLHGFIRVRAGISGVEPVDRRCFRDIERFPLRDALGDVEQHRVAEFSKTDEMRERATDLARADQCDFLACH